MVNRKMALAVCVAAVFVAALAPRVGATAAAKTTYLTFSQPVALPGIGLNSGTYIFEIANPDTTADVVRVMSRDRSISYFMGFTRPIARPKNVDPTQNVSLSESAAGVAPRVTVWWPGSESTGREFVYPAH
jgi:hypothetical protein